MKEDNIERMKNEVTVTIAQVRVCVRVQKSVKTGLT